MRALCEAWDDRGRDTIRKMERAGYLPQANLHAPRATRGLPNESSRRGERLYLRSQIEAVVRITKELEIFSAYARAPKATWDELRKRLVAEWTPDWVRSAIQEQRSTR